MHEFEDVILGSLIDAVPPRMDYLLKNKDSGSFNSLVRRNIKDFGCALLLYYLCDRDKIDWVVAGRMLQLSSYEVELAVGIGWEDMRRGTGMERGLERLIYLRDGDV